MLCDSCGKRESILSYTKIHEDGIEEVHLCEVCAEKKLREDFANNFEMLPQLEEMIGNIFKLTSMLENADETLSCSTCGWSFEKFQKTGQVGCEHCYETFAEEIINYLKMLHLSASHRGKMPENVDERIKNDRKIKDLQDDLSLLIQLEDYEGAAKVRDQIKELRNK